MDGLEDLTPEECIQICRSDQGTDQILYILVTLSRGPSLEVSFNKPFFANLEKAPLEIFRKFHFQGNSSNCHELDPITGKIIHVF